MAASLLPIMLGLGRALLSIKAADGGRASCPHGHPLRAAISEPGSQCDCCGRVAESTCVAVECIEDHCPFLTCARRPCCAPLSIARVLKALQIKFAVADLSFDKDAG